MNDLLQAQKALERRLGATEVKEVNAPPLTYAPRVVNPFPLASSGNAPGDFYQNGTILLRAFNCGVLVLTTNSATQFWTIRLTDQLGNVLASFVTSAIAANAYTRFQPGIILQPASSNVVLVMTATATLSPGAIFLWPEVLVLR